MKIIDVIQQIKGMHKGNLEIEKGNTRDKILYGNPYKTCTGLVVTCCASIDVIRKTNSYGANLIICHECMFWNHGDKTDWLILGQNKTFLEKKRLLDETGITVWRNHDFIHSGMIVGRQYCDGIFYGFAHQMQWIPYVISSLEKPDLFQIPKTIVKDLAQLLIHKLQLNGAKIIGNPNNKVEKIYFCGHILGKEDNKIITKMEKENIDLLLVLELIDSTVCEYVLDSSQLGYHKSIITLGHFNTEEAGMKFFNSYVSKLFNYQIPNYFIPSADLYGYVTKEKE